jgi:hypothetical protein
MRAMAPAREIVPLAKSHVRVRDRVGADLRVCPQRSHRSAEKFSRRTLISYRTANLVVRKRLSELRMAFDELLEMRFVFVSDGCGKFRVTSSPTLKP